MAHGRRHGIPTRLPGANSCTLVLAGSSRWTRGPAGAQPTPGDRPGGPRAPAGPGRPGVLRLRGAAAVVAVQHHVRQVHGWVRLCAVPPMLAKPSHILGRRATCACYPSAPAALAVSTSRPAALAVSDSEDRWGVAAGRPWTPREGCAAQRGKNPGQAPSGPAVFGGPSGDPGS